MHCCDDMRYHANRTCGTHTDPSECPDAVLVHTATGYGIPIHDGGSSFVAIAFCPWCGTRLASATVDGTVRPSVTYDADRKRITVVSPGDAPTTVTVGSK